MSCLRLISRHLYLAGLVLILGVTLFIPDWGLAASSTTHIFSLDKKIHPIQEVLQKADFKFDRKNLIPYESVTLSPANPEPAQTESLDYGFVSDRLYTFSLTEESSILLTVLTEDFLSPYDHYWLELIFPDGSTRTYHNLYSIPVSTLPPGRFYARFWHPRFSHYKLSIKKTRTDYTGVGQSLITPEEKTSAENLKKLSEFVVNGGNLVVVSNHEFSKNYEIEFSNKNLAINQKMSIAQDDDTEYVSFSFGTPAVEIISFKDLSANYFFEPLMTIPQGVLAGRLTFTHQEKNTGNILFLSRDLFHLPASIQLLLLKKIKASSPLPISNLPINFRLWSFLTIDFLRQTVFVFVFIILFFIFFKPVKLLISQPKNISLLLPKLISAGSRLADHIRRYFYKIMISGFLIGFIFIVGIFYFYKWYTTSSGLDLFPNFQINVFLQTIGFTNNLHLVWLILAVALGLFCILLMILFWSQIYSLIKFLTRLTESSSYKITENIKVWFLIGWTFCLIFLLASLVSNLSNGLKWLMTFIILSPLILIFYLLTPQPADSISPWQKKFMEAGYYGLLFLPILFLARLILPFLYFSFFPHGLALGPIHLPAYKTELRITAKADERKNSSFMSIHGSHGKLLSEVILKNKDESTDGLAGQKKLLYSYQTPLQLKIELPVNDYFSSFLFPKSGDLSLRLKASDDTWISSESLSPRLQSAYLPSLNNYQQLATTQNFSLYAKPNTVFKSVTNPNRPLPKIVSELVAAGDFIGLPEVFRPNILSAVDMPLADFGYAKYCGCDWYDKQPFRPDEKKIEATTNLQNSRLVFFSKLTDSLDFTVDFQRLNSDFGNRLISFKVLDPLGNTVLNEDFKLKSGVIGLPGSIETKNWQMPLERPGIYRLEIKNITPASNDQDNEKKEIDGHLDYAIRRLGINSGKFVMRGNFTDFGGDTFYFKNFSKNFNYRPTIGTKLSFFDLQGGLKLVNNTAQSALAINPKDVPIDREKLWKIYLPPLPGNLDGIYNFYAFSEDSWFYPYTYYFTDNYDLANLTIVPPYQPTKISADGFVTINLPFKIAESRILEKKPIKFTITSSWPSSLVLIDDIKTVLTLP